MATTTSLTANYRRQQGGFTLIEIAIVLAIIGLLIAALTAARGLQQGAEDDQALAWMEGLANSTGEFARRYGGDSLDELDSDDFLDNISGSINVPSSNVDQRNRFGAREDLIEASLATGEEGFGADRWVIVFDNVPEDLAVDLDRRLTGEIDSDAGQVRGHGVDSTGVDEIDATNTVTIGVAVNPPAYSSSE